MSTEKQEKQGIEENSGRDENSIEHLYFDRTPAKDWKLSDVLVYYLKQNVPVDNVYDLTEQSLQKCFQNRKSLKKRCQNMMQELMIMKTINQSLGTTRAPATTPLTPVTTSSSAPKVADLINNYGTIEQTNNITQDRKRKTSNISTTSISVKDNKNDGKILVKKPRKSFSFTSPLDGHLLTINKPRVTKNDASQLKDAFEVIISNTPSTPTSNIIIDEYNENIKDQHANKCLESLPKVKSLLNQVTNGEYSNILEAVDTYKCDQNHSEGEIKGVRLIKYIMNDYHANCEKPGFYTNLNERTPYCEYVIPVFKYFSAVFKSLSFMWCEKGLEANKKLAICLDDTQKKLMDGIGYSIKDKSERLVIECSGEIDGEHTEEDTLKLMEATSRCLKNEMSQYLSASWETFGDRKVLAVQSVSNTITLLSTKRVDENKWCFVEQRSAIIPRDWNDRYHWVKVMELLIKLKELLDEQEIITQTLKKEHVGLIKVDSKSTIRHMLDEYST